ncbi:MAG: flagellin [Acidobacteriaceae bacterium]|jgi:flagellin
MPLGVLNNISAVYAENNLNQTQSSLQNVLTQLSSGSRINSGADDPAGLSIANGLAANSAALSQSSSNASEGAGFLQVADGALSQVTSLLTSAVTLATEAGGGTLSNSQMAAANQEYQDILTQIGTIGSTTEYNGISVFSSDQTTSAMTWASGAGSPAASASATASAIAGSSIVTGGTTAGTAPAVTQSFAAPASIAWTSSDSGAVLTSAAITSGAKLAGDLKFTPTVSGSAGTSISIDLSTLSGSTLSAQASSLATALNAAAGNSDSDYTVSVNGSNELVVGLGASATGDNISALGSGSSSTTTQAVPDGFTMSVTDGDSISGTIDLTGSGSGTMPSNIVLAGVTTANLQSVVNTDLNGTSQNPDYTVAYSNGTLTVGLTAQAATDHITGLSAADDSTNGLAETSPKTASIAFTSGDTLGGSFTITPTVNGTAATGSGILTVNVAGLNTTAAVVDAVNTALGTAADDYTVGYANGKLSIAVNSQGATDGVNSVSIANGTGNNALSQGTSTVSVVNSANSLMGNFTLTPTGSSTTAVPISLTGVTTATLASSLQTDLGSDYAVAYNSTSGDLSIGVSSTGVAAGITGFTVAEASQGAASQETPVAGGVNIYTSDGTTTGSQNYNVTVGILSDASVGTSSGSSAMGTSVTASVGGTTGTGGVVAGAGQGTSLTGTGLSSQASAEAALQTVDNAINAVAYQRGQVGANINTLTAASNIASSQMTNITSAENTITATDYAAATSNMSKYEILTQTGISALAQANSTQQMVTKLLQ